MTMEDVIEVKECSTEKDSWDIISYQKLEALLLLTLMWAGDLDWIWIQLDLHDPYELGSNLKSESMQGWHWILISWSNFDM